VSSDFGGSQTVKARKRHPCAWCREPILAGEYHHRFTGKWEGDWQDWRMHLDCIEAHYREDRENHNFGEICGESHQRGRTCGEIEANRFQLIVKLSEIVESSRRKGASDFETARAVLREVEEWQHSEKLRIEVARKAATTKPAAPAAEIAS
jgi:hypothetical protein